MDIRDYIKQSISLDRKRLEHYRQKFNGIKINGTLVMRGNSSKNKEYYYYRLKSGKDKYLGKKDRNTVIALQHKRLAKEMMERLRHNIRIKEWACEALMEDDVAEVQKSLPKAYQPNKRFEKDEARKRKPFPQSENPYRREDLVILTSFGLYVRTKSEAQIAELLYSLGIKFYYEKALTLEFVGEYGYDKKTYYPDFTIILPNGEKIFWEHKGMLSKKGYLERDMQREMVYNMNGIYQPHNYMVTADGPNNTMDMESTKLIVQGWLLPKLTI